MKILFAWFDGIINCSQCTSMNDPKWTHCCKCGAPLEDWEVANYPGGSK